MDNTEIVVKPIRKRKSRAKPKNVEVMPQCQDETTHLDENITDNYDPDFLSELNNTNELNREAVKLFCEAKLPQYEVDCEEITPVKTRKTRTKKVVEEIEPTPLYGKEKLVLIKKIESYKVLFPNELQTFYYSKDQEINELENVILEIQSIIEIGNVDAFITESILQSIKMCEGYSSKTPYDITGMSLALKSNKQFHDLLKLMYLKYNTFSQIPPEYQLIMIISTTALVCVQTNKNKKNMSSYLDEPINI